MRINEFIEKVNEHDGMQAKKVYERIVIGTPNNMGIFSIPEDATNFIEIDTWATSNSLYWKKEDREYLSTLIEGFLHTPVRERFPESKYTVQVLADYDESFLNVGKDDGFAFFKDEVEAGSVQTQFTQAEIDELKQRDDLAIDWNKAIIEPVEGDE